MECIEDYLRLPEDSFCRLEDLHRVATLHLKYSQDEIAVFYLSNYQHIFHFEDGTQMSIAKAFLGLTDLSDSLDDRLYILVLIHNFIELNCMEFTATLENIEAFVMILERSESSDAYSKLPTSARTISILNAGLLSPYMFNISKDDEIKLSEHTFKFLLRHGVDVTALMGYSLKAHEIGLVAESLAASRRLRSQCIGYMSEQGVINDTTFIIAVLLDLPCAARNVDHTKMYGLFCSGHNSGIYIPFSTLRSVGLMSRLEVYYLYLLNKKDYSLDLADIYGLFAAADEHRVVHSADEESPSCHCSRPGHHGASAGSVDTSSPGTSPPGVPSEGFTSLSFMEELGPPDKGPSGVLVAILDLVLSRNADFGFQKYAFRLLLKLEAKPYFLKLFCKYSREMIRNELRPALYGDIYDDVEHVLSYLSIHCADCAAALQSEKTPACSLEMLDSDLFLSSMDVEAKMALSTLEMAESQKSAMHEMPSCKLPILEFADFPWIGEHQAIALMERYVEAYPAKELVRHYLCLTGNSAPVDAFFAANYQEIADDADRGLIMCKLGVTIEAGKFSRAAIRAIVSASGTLYSLKQIVLHSSEVGRKDIKKFIECLSDEQEREINLTVGREIVSQKFVILYVDHLMSRYELSFIVNTLSFIMDTYSAQVATKILRHLISHIREMFFVETHFDHIALLCKKAMRFSNNQIATLNEKILSFVLACGNIMEKDIVIGNVKAG